MGKIEESRLLLKRLASTNTLPWFCIKDFNELMNSRENEGGSTHPARQMKKLCEVISTCQLRDFGYVGQDFTWTRRFGDIGWIKERLDRALVSTNWVSKFPRTQLHHKSKSSSDHCVLILKEIQVEKRRR